MDPTRLKKLRVQQFLLMNTFILVAVIIFTLLIDRFSLSSFQRIVGIIIFTLAIVSILKKTANLNFYGLFPSMRELMEYEKNKLGTEYPKTRWLQIASQLFISVIFIAQSFFSSAPSIEPPLKDIMLMTIPAVLVLLAAMNIALIYHSKKIDSGTNESLKGFTVKSILVGVAIGVPSAFIVTMLLILIVKIK